MVFERVPELQPYWKALRVIGDPGRRALMAAQFDDGESGAWHLHVRESRLPHISDAELETEIARQLLCVYLNWDERVLAAVLGDDDVDRFQPCRDAVIYDFLYRRGFEAPHQKRGVPRSGIDCSRLGIFDIWPLELGHSKHNHTFAADLAAKLKDGSEPPLPPVDSALARLREKLLPDFAPES